MVANSISSTAHRDEQHEHHIKSNSHLVSKEHTLNKYIYPQIESPWLSTTPQATFKTQITNFQRLNISIVNEKTTPCKLRQNIQLALRQHWIYFSNTLPQQFLLNLISLFSELDFFQKKSALFRLKIPSKIHHNFTIILINQTYPDFALPQMVNKKKTKQRKT